MKAKRLVILGAGESGTGAAILAKKYSKRDGYEVFVSDNGKIKEKYKSVLYQNNILWEESKHSEDLILNADEVIKSPGIPDNVAIIKKLKDLKVPIISEIEFAGRYISQGRTKIIGITGSSGKTTTSMLTYEILKNARLNVGLAGNIGNSFARQVAEKNYDYYVLELSCFQLDGIHKFRVNIAVLLNITRDHLNRYDNNLQKYISSKFRIIRNQTSDDIFIYCADDKIIQKELTKYKIKSKKYPFSINSKVENGAYLEPRRWRDRKNKILININNRKMSVSLENFGLIGTHNTCNAMASTLIAHIMYIKKDVIRESLTHFTTLEHRLEYVTNVRGIAFYNDSKASNVNSAWYALQTMYKPIIWIAGGDDKGNDYSVLKDVVREKVKAIICLGKDNCKIIDAFKNDIALIIETRSMKESVEIAYRLGNRGDIVLLSPACASFDLFEDYRDRGRQFKEAVRDL